MVYLYYLYINIIYIFINLLIYLIDRLDTFSNPTVPVKLSCCNCPNYLI